MPMEAHARAKFFKDSCSGNSLTSICTRRFEYAGSCSMTSSLPRVLQRQPSPIACERRIKYAPYRSPLAEPAVMYILLGLSCGPSIRPFSRFSILKYPFLCEVSSTIWSVTGTPVQFSRNSLAAIVTVESDMLSSISMSFISTDAGALTPA